MYAMLSALACRAIFMLTSNKALLHTKYAILYYKGTIKQNKYKLIRKGLILLKKKIKLQIHFVKIFNVISLLVNIKIFYFNIKNKQLNLTIE